MYSGVAYLYAKVGGVPTLTSSYASNTTKNVNARSLNPCGAGAGTMYVGVYGYTDAKYSIVLNRRPYSHTYLKSGNTVSDVTSYNCYYYFQIDVPDQVALLQVAVNLPQYKNYAGLLLANGYLPTSNRYSWYNTTYTGSNCISLNNPSSGTYYLALSTSYYPQAFTLQMELNGDGSCQVEQQLDEKKPSMIHPNAKPIGIVNIRP